MRYYLFRGGGGRFLITSTPPQKTGLTVVTFPPLPTKDTGRYHAINGQLRPALPATTSIWPIFPVEVRQVPEPLAKEILELRERHERLQREVMETYMQYVRLCADAYDALEPVPFPVPEEPS
jgi:hypothetical protein